MSDTPSHNRHSANQMWGGRFVTGPDEIMEQINASIDFDKVLYAQDIAGSKAHARMLVKKNIISADDGEAILGGLDSIWAEIEAGEFKFSRAIEDIHMNIEASLAELIGEAAGRLHTARSRNDQIALDFRLWVKEAMEQTDVQLASLIDALLIKADQHKATLMPGFTHLQTAQPVTYGHHCMAYVEMFARDLSRIRDGVSRLDECPLGAAALAGLRNPRRRDRGRRRDLLPRRREPSSQKAARI